ncbi:hypothetical protein [Bradyrhizobium sp. USDA 4473]
MRKQRGDRRYSRARHHLREIERVLYDRRGTDDCDLYLHHAVAEAAACFRLMQRERGERPDVSTVLKGLELWCDRNAPDLAGSAADVAARAVEDRWGLSKADDLGGRLRLSDADRTRLAIRTIGAYDVDKKARETRRREKKRLRDRERARAKRAAAGKQTRQEWLKKNSLSRSKPWIAMGVCKRTYERRRKAGKIAA